MQEKCDEARIVNERENSGEREGKMSVDESEEAGVLDSANGTMAAIRIIAAVEFVAGILFGVAIASVLG